MPRFAGWTALVTGASAGLGAEFCRQLAPVAGTLILVARRADRLEALKSEILARHPRCAVHLFPADLSSPEEINRLAAAIHSAGLEVDLLVNNAGLGDLGPFVSAPSEKILSMLSVNMTALTLLTRAFLPGMTSRRRGAVLNVSSSAGYLPLPTFAAYAATKAYVNSFSEALLAEVRADGITVTTLCPGPVKTEFGEVASRPGATRQFAPPSWAQVAPEIVVEQALEAAARGRARVTPGILVRLFVWIADFVPTAVWRQFYRFGNYQ